MTGSWPRAWVLGKQRGVRSGNSREGEQDQGRGFFPKAGCMRIEQDAAEVVLRAIPPSRPQDSMAKTGWRLGEWSSSSQTNQRQHQQHQPYLERATSGHQQPSIVVTRARAIRSKSRDIAPYFAICKPSHWLEPGPTHATLWGGTLQAKGARDRPNKEACRAPPESQRPALAG
jgi:hypothetical protein